MYTLEKIRRLVAAARASKHPLRFIIARVLGKTGLNRFFTIPLPGCRIKFSDSNLAFALFVNAEDRHGDYEFLHKVLRPGQIYVDVGANIGTLALSAASIVGSRGKVIAIEPHPVTFKYLNENVHLNKFSNVNLINSAVGANKGSIQFSNIKASDDQNKVLSQHSDGIEVRIDTLDNLLGAKTNIDLLKIDVEGYEKFVLEGAPLTLHKTDIVFFESWEKHFGGYGYSTTEIMEILKSYGFEVYKLNSNTITPLPMSYKSLQCENLVAIKDPTRFCSNFGFIVEIGLQ